MDLASQRGSGEGIAANGWGNISRHRQQQSLSSIPQMADSMGSMQADTNPIGSRPYRHSLDLNQQYKDISTENTPPSNISPSTTQVLSTPPKLQSSFSANDVPTVKTMTNPGGSSANAHAQQHFNNHNASIGRIPPGVLKRHSRELSSDSHVASTQPGAAFPSIQSQLQANAPTFGPTGASQAPVQSPVSAGSNSTASPSSSGGAYYYQGFNQTSPNNNYNMGVLTMGMQNMNMNAYPHQNFTGYGAMYQASVQPRDSQQRVMQQRRAQNDDGMFTFYNLDLLSTNSNISYESLHQSASGAGWGYHIRALQRPARLPVPAEATREPHSRAGPYDLDGDKPTCRRAYDRSFWQLFVPEAPGVL